MRPRYTSISSRLAEGGPFELVGELPRDEGDEERADGPDDGYAELKGESFYPKACWVQERVSERA